MFKSRIGPFALEAPLSVARRSGQMFRAVHLEQQKLAALRVFKIPMGMTPEIRQEYTEQIEALKTLRHAGIARCYGGGYDSNVAFLAYELVDGESLDVMLKRRDRLPWETVFEFSQQLTEALQYAHEREWIHGRLKPDKILVTQDGVLKIGDWRRQAISQALHMGSPEPEQLLFAAPECLGGAELSQKADLYSAGALLYYMLTGQTCYQIESDSTTRESIHQAALAAPIPDVRSIVLDCPVWFSSIVTQLLSKDPQDRPFSAAALNLALKEAQKRQSQGVGVLQHAASGFSPLKVQADRREAEKVLGIQPKKKRKRQSEVGFWEQTWVLATGLVLSVLAIVWLLLPPSESTLYARALPLLPPETERWNDWNRAKDYLVPIVERFPEGEHAAWAEDRIAWIEAQEELRELRRQHRFNEQADWTDAETQYWNALEFEQFGDNVSALNKYRAVYALYKDDPQAASICYLAQESIARIEEQETTTDDLEAYIERKLAEAESAYDEARIVAARELWESIVELYSDNASLSEQVQIANQRLQTLQDR